MARLWDRPRGEARASIGSSARWKLSIFGGSSLTTLIVVRMLRRSLETLLDNL